MWILPDGRDSRSSESNKSHIKCNFCNICGNVDACCVEILDNSKCEKVEEFPELS